MSWWWLLIVLLVLIFVFYLSMTAGRLDRLHRRIDQSAATLDAQCVRRASAASEVALSGFLDPASALLLAQAAHDARENDLDVLDDQRQRSESDLTTALRVALPADLIDEIREDADVEPMLAELHAACTRTALARRFHNDAVRACRQLRQQRAVRWFRLAGHTPWPASSDWDDAIPFPWRDSPEDRER